MRSARNGLDGDGVVGAEGGDIAAAHAIVHHLHACAVQPADHRTAHARPEAGVLDAWDAFQRLPQRTALVLVQLLARKHADRPDQILGGLVQGRGGDHHAVELVRRLPMRVLRRRTLLGHGDGRRRQDEGQRGSQRMWGNPTVVNGHERDFR